MPIPGVNRARRPAGMSRGSMVCGLWPFRAEYRTVEKRPKPVMVIGSSRARDSVNSTVRTEFSSSHSLRNSLAMIFFVS